MKKYYKEAKKGDWVDIDDVNRIKNCLYRKALDKLGNTCELKDWNRAKREIKKKVKFKIMEL